MKKLSAKDKMMLMVMGAVLMIGGLYMFYVKPAKAELTKQTDRVASAQSNVDTLRTQLAQLVATNKPKNKVTQTNIADSLRLAKAYPADQDVPEAILQLERLSKEAGVSFTDGTPDDGTDVAGTTGTSFTITVSGSYFRVQDFIWRLHNQVNVDANGRLEIGGRLFAITSADLSPDGTSEVVTSRTSVKATITAIAFSRSSAAAAATTTPTAATTPAAGTTPAANTTTTPTTGGATQ